MPTEGDVLRLADFDPAEIECLLAGFGLELTRCDGADPIPGSYWGGDEAGLRGDRLYARDATPVHSILHETAHYLCLTPARRALLDTDAGSDDAEETAACYLQVLLAARLRGYGQERLFADMDSWGYSFRLGSARAWFEQDAGEARQWLLEQAVIDAQDLASPRPRGFSDCAAPALKFAKSG